MTHAPHFLRYLTAAVLLIKRGKNSDGRRLRRLLKNLGHAMQNVEYMDAIYCVFVYYLSNKFDFKKAQQNFARMPRRVRTLFLLVQTNGRLYGRGSCFLL